MAFTVPTTRSTGYVVGASVWNAEIVDNMKWLSGDYPSCKAQIAGSQAVGANVPSILGFGSELWDVGDMHSTAVNISRFTAPVTGRYQVMAFVSFEAAVFYGWIEPYISGAATGERSGMAFSSGADYGICSVSEHQLGAGAYVEIVAWHNYLPTPLDVWGTCVVKWVSR